MNDNFERYWIQATTGDPLPAIGSGFRIVDARVTCLGVDLRTQSGVEATVRRKMWDMTPHVLHTGQTITEALEALSKYKEPTS